MSHHAVVFRPRMLRRMREYVGAGLLGAITCGIVFSPSVYHDLMQWIGAGVCTLLYALTNSHVGK